MRFALLRPLVFVLRTSIASLRGVVFYPFFGFANMVFQKILVELGFGSISVEQLFAQKKFEMMKDDFVLPSIAFSYSSTQVYQ